MPKNQKKKGIIFWITGLSGSGKSSISNKLEKKISKLYGPTLNLSGDDLRKIFNFNKYSKKNRLNYAFSYSKFCKKISDSNVNLIFSTVSLFDKVRKWNRKNIYNYVEIYIETNIDQLIKKKKKFFYKGNYKNIVGKNLKAEFPKSPDIIIKNDFTKSLSNLSNELLLKIKKINL
tara:strand:- start:879 stop:1403 length:525 start_codon:yes stop_codon:yes gene_type:complete